MNDFLTWLQSGSTLNVAGAITVLATFVRVVMVPGAVKLLSKYTLTDNMKRLIALVCSETLVIAVDVVRPVPGMGMPQLLAFGAIVTGAAIGVHQVTK